MHCHRNSSIAPKQARKAARILQAAGERPGCDHLVADIFVNLAFLHHDRFGKVAEKAVEQAMEADLAEPLGGSGRTLQVDEKDVLLDVRAIVATGQEISSTFWPGSPSTANRKLAAKPTAKQNRMS